MSDEAHRSQYGIFADNMARILAVCPPEWLYRIKFSNKSRKFSFLAVKELKIHGALYRRRTDIVGFVNGR